MRASLCWIVLAAACQDAGELGVVDPDDLTDDGTPDTDDTLVDPNPNDTDDVPDDTDVDSDDPGVPDERAEAWHHVVGTLELLPEDQGFDLDGDGNVDNAIGAFSRLLGGPVEDFLAQGDSVVLLQTWGVGDPDPRAFVGFLAGADTDGDGADNLDGDELFAVSEDITPAGRALTGVPVRIERSDRYTGQLPRGVIPLFGFQLPTATVLRLEGRVNQGEHEVTLGTAISVQTIGDLLDQAGLGFATQLIAGSADVDTNGDNRPDALSLAIRLGGPSCEVEIVAPQP